MTNQEDPEIPGESEPIALACGDETAVYKEVTRTRTLTYGPMSWPPSNWGGLNQAQRQQVMDDLALEALNNTQAGKDLAKEMQTAAEDAAKADASITCNPCAPVAGHTDVGECAKDVLRPAPIVDPNYGGSNPPVVNAAVATSGTGVTINATFKATYAVTVVCKKDGCRCTDCGQFHPDPDQ